MYNLLKITADVATLPVTEISIYPNPVENTLFIENAASATATIINTSGTVMMQQYLTYRKAEVNTRKSPAGIYFIRITNGAQTSLHKFVRL